jgi:hypothetical protein
MRKSLVESCRGCDRVRPMRRWLISAVGMILAFGAVGLAPAGFAAGPGEQEGGDFGPGCALDRPAIAHHADGVVAQTPPGKEHRAPIPCATTTGFRTSEVSLVVTNEGTLLFQPAFPEAGFPIGLIRSVDRGVSWDFILRSPVGAQAITAIDQNLWVDRDTGRAFWLKIDSPIPFPPRLDRSDDDGQTWFPSGPPCPNRAFGPLGCSKPVVFTGPPTPRLKHLMQGYPNVVYVCGGGLSTNPLACQKSLDGGNTFGPAVVLPAPAGVSCVLYTSLALNGVVDQDGTVYVPFTPCQLPYVAISRDEGNTWQLVLVADTLTLGGGELSLGMDKQGNLYAAWVGSTDRLPYLAISRDGGLQWGTPLMIGAPGVKEAALPGLVAGARGQVAVTYMGSTNAPLPFPPFCSDFSLSCPGYEDETWDVYITETWTALDREPRFWSATLNDPAQPTWYGCSPSFIGFATAPGSGGGCRALPSTGGPALGGRIDYYGATTGPDGTAWVGFVQECPGGLPVPGNPNCPSTLTGALTDSLIGMVGRLVRARGEADDDTDGDDH